MGLINRLRRITRGRIEAFLDAIENPAAILPLLIEELAAQVTVAANAEAKALTSVKSLQRKLDEATGRVLRMRDGAQAALAAGQEHLARQAIALQLQAEKDQAEARRAVELAQKAYIEARDVRRQLAEELESLRSRKRGLLASADRCDKDRQNSRAAGSPVDAAAAGRSLLDEVARMEEKIVNAAELVQAQTEVAGMLREELSSGRIDELLRGREVQRRLDELKKELGR